MGEEANLTLGDMDGAKRKLAAENADLLRQLQEIENNANLMAKYKIQLMAQLEEVRRNADGEAKERQSLFGKYKNLEHELDGHREHLDEESSSKEDILRNVAKANQEADFWRQKFETEGIARAEDIEMTKMKLQARLSECQGTIEQLQLKVAQIEKAKAKLQVDIEQMAAQADAAHLLNNSMEKKAKQFDKIVGEWKLKVDSTSMDLDTAQKECRNASSELFRVKSAYEESILQLDEVRKENKVLSNEIKDIMDQISEGGKSIHEIDKIRKRLEAEKMELQAALEEAEGALEQKYVRFNLHMKMSKGQKRLLEITLLPQKGKLTLYRMLLKRHVPFLSNPTGQDVWLNKNFLTPTRLCPSSPAKTRQLLVPRENWIPNCKLFMVIWMRWAMSLVYLMIRLKRQWLMLLVLLMSSAKSKNWLNHLKKIANCSKPRLRTPRLVWMMPSQTPLKEERRL